MLTVYLNLHFVQFLSYLNFVSSVAFGDLVYLEF